MDTGKAIKCIVGFEGAIESIKLSFVNPHLIYVASLSTLYAFDISCEGVIIKKSTSKVTLEYEINTFCVHPNGKYIGVTDDNCDILLIDLSNDGQILDIKKTYRILSRFHTNIIGSLSFKNKINSNELLSGGFDYQCCLWDLNTFRRIQTMNFEQLYNLENTKKNKKNPNFINNNDNNSISSTSNQLFNPPFVQFVQYAFNDRVVVCALGDGKVFFFLNFFKTM
jgi:WD40 repeat protein